MPWLETKIPPRVVALAVAFLMWASSAVGPRFDLPQAHHWATALAGALVGAAITSAGAIALRAAKTTLLPMRPRSTSSLVTRGIFRFTRNPMYLGLALALVAWAAYLSAAWPLLGPPLFVAYLHRYQIRPEERVLFDLFGAEYADYTRRVRRWL